MSVPCYVSKERLEIQNVFVVAEARNRPGANTQSEHFKWFAHQFERYLVSFLPFVNAKAIVVTIARLPKEMPLAPSIVHQNRF